MNTQDTTPMLSLEDRIRALDAEQLAALVRHFDVLHARALVCNGPAEYGQVLAMDDWPDWANDVEARHAAGWILGFSTASCVSVFDLADVAESLTETRPPEQTPVP